MVTYAQKHGNKPCARAFGTTVKTVRKWRLRYEEYGYKGLSDLSRAPKDPPLKIPDSSKRRTISLKKRLRSFGAERIKRDFGVALSAKAIRKIWHEEGLIKRKRKKHKTKKDLRAIKGALKLFEQIDVDTKHLYDIPEYWLQMRRLGLPVYQYTARDVVSGIQFLGFADECYLSYATLFADLLIRHLALCGVELSGSRIQTDNGSEFIGSWQAKESSAFTERIEEVDGLMHHTIPPGAHTHQADVETVHRLIEDEFYEVERFSSRRDFLAKATTYQLWFNVARENSYKGHKTPWEIIQERDATIKPQIATLPPLFLDELKKMEQKTQRGYDVVPYPSTSPRSPDAFHRSLINSPSP
jgi:transposase